MNAVTGEFTPQRPVTRSFGVLFDLRLNKRLSKQSWGWWFKTPSRSLWRHCNVFYRVISSVLWVVVTLEGVGKVNDTKLQQTHQSVHREYIIGVYCIHYIRTRLYVRRLVAVGFVYRQLILVVKFDKWFPNIVARLPIVLLFNTLRPRQNGRHFPDDILKCIFLNDNVIISIKISLKLVPNGPNTYIPALIQIMTWCRPGDKPLSEPMMVSLLTHICITQLQRFDTMIVTSNAQWSKYLYSSIGSDNDLVPSRRRAIFWTNDG